MKYNRRKSLPALAIMLIGWIAVPVSTSNAQPKRESSRALPQQDRTVAQPPSEQLGAGVVTDSGKDHLISPGDIIEIQVEDAPELSRSYQVTAAGDIEMSVLGHVPARGKTVYELARQIANGLREQDYLKKPNVTAIVKQYRSRAFFIQGAVQKSGLYQLDGRPSLLTLIGLAGGLTDNHGSTIFILRPNKLPQQIPAAQDLNSKGQPPDTNTTPQSPQSQATDSESGAAADYELIKVNLGALYKGQFDQNQRLEPGDIVNIPRADVFFVAGEVQAPGSFPLKEGTTLRQAISLAQGTTFKAKSSQGIIFRENSVTGSRQEIKVDIAAVMSGRKEDIAVQANDVIIVPNSRSKSVGGTVLTAFGLNMMFRLPVR